MKERNKQINFRVSEAECEAIKQLAKKRGLSISSLMRDLTRCEAGTNCPLSEILQVVCDVSPEDIRIRI